MQASYQLEYFPKTWKKGNKIYLKKPGKSSYYVHSSHRSIPLTNAFGNIFERVILQESVNTLAEKNNKKKNAPQALLPLVGQMSQAISSGQNGVVVMAGLESAFDAVWRDGAIYKLLEEGMRKNIPSVFDNFLCNQLSKSLANTYSSNWVQAHTGRTARIPFKSIHLPCLHFRSNYGGRNTRLKPCQK